jgi:hypothetical protein
MPVASLGTYAIGTEAIAGEALHGQPTVAITAPTTNQLVNAALTVTWTYTANPITLLAQQSYRLRLYSGDRSLTFYDTGWVTDSGTTATIPVTSFSDTFTYQVGLIARPIAPDNTGIDDSVEQLVVVIADFSDVSVYPDVTSVGTVYEIGINGVGYMLADMTDVGVVATMATRRYTRKTQALNSQRFATGGTPFSEAVDRYVFKNMNDFSGGAGQRFYDQPDSDPTAFWDSENVNPFVPGKLTMNPAIQAASTSAGPSSVAMTGTVFNGEWYGAGYAGDKSIGHGTAPNSSSSFTVAAATTLLDITSSGTNWYAAAGAQGIFRGASAADPGAAWSAIAGRVCEWTQDRLSVAYPTSGTTPNIFTTLTSAGVEEVGGGRLILPVGWSITSITSGGGKVWFAANSTSSDRGAVYVWTIGSANAPTVALEFPVGQRPTAVFAYQGNVFLRVGEWTTLASTYSKAYIYRCVPDSSGALTPTLVTTLGDSTSTVDQSKGSFTARGNTVFFTWQQMTSLVSTHGIGAIDLVGGGWCKWTYLGVGSPTLLGDLITLGQQLVWFVTTTLSVVTAESTPQSAGYLKTSLIDGDSTLLKLYDSVSLVGALDTSARTITVDYSTDLLTYVNIPSATLTGPNASAETQWGKRARGVSFKIGLVGFTSPSTTYLSSFTAKLHQLGIADQIITLPIYCDDDIADLKGKRLDADSGPGKGSLRARVLESFAQTRVKFQDKDWPWTRTSYTVEVEDVQAHEWSVKSPLSGKTQESLVVLLTLRRSLR